MGNSKPPPSSIDLVDSYARRRDDRVELVLQDPQFALGSTTTIEARRKDAVVEFEVREVVDERGRRVVAIGPRAALENGPWRLHLIADGQREVLGVRLLVQGDRPLVLLWGATALPSRRPDPRPRALSGAPAGAPHSRGVRRLLGGR